MRAFWRLVSVVPLICTIFVLSVGVVRGSRVAATARGPSFVVGGYAARWAARVAAALRAAWLRLLRGVILPSPVAASCLA